MEILALDTATHTGYAHSRGVTGHKWFEAGRGESPGMRWIKFRKWLNDFLDAHPTDLIIYELEGTARSRAAAHVAHGFTAVVEEVAAARSIEVTNVAPSGLKKWATGNGNAKKPAMVDAAERIARRPLEDDNEADAILILAYAKEKFCGDGAKQPGGPAGH